MVTEEKTCSQCNLRKPLRDFLYSGPRRTLMRWSIRCRACKTTDPKEDPYRRRRKAKQWYKENRERAIRVVHNYRRNNPEKILLKEAKKRSKKRGLSFNLTVADISIPETCPVLGIPLRPGIGKPGPASPTLDRIFPSGGYVRGNVIVISYRANTIKSDATVADLEKVYKFYAGITKLSRVELQGRVA